MFSPEHFPESLETEAEDLVSWFWKRLADQFDLQGILLVRVDLSEDDYKVISSYHIPSEPFNGSDKACLTDVLSDCFKRYPKPHIHNIGDFALSDISKRYSQHLQGTTRIWFIPAKSGNGAFVFLGFSRHDSEIKVIPESFFSELGRILTVIGLDRGLRDAARRLEVTELFVKEIGHDVASSVQATLAKARTIFDGRVTGSAVARKAKEIENEIMAANRMAEFLGAAVDPNYQISDLKDFDLLIAVRANIDQYASEAAERHIELLLNSGAKTVPMWGDAKAVEQCVGQVIINAIKYSFGGSTIRINIRDDEDFIIVNVSNRGIALPQGDQIKLMWDFGFRGKIAKELHVNGSGIGLYTAKKIALAHFGTASASHNSEITNFYVRLPKKRYLHRKLNPTLTKL